MVLNQLISGGESFFSLRQNTQRQRAFEDFVLEFLITLESDDRYRYTMPPCRNNYDRSNKLKAPYFLFLETSVDVTLGKRVGTERHQDDREFLRKGVPKSVTPREQRAHSSGDRTLFGFSL